MSEESNDINKLNNELMERFKYGITFFTRWFAFGLGIGIPATIFGLISGNFTLG